MYNKSKKKISKKIYVNKGGDGSAACYKSAAFAVKKNHRYYLRFQDTVEPTKAAPYSFSLYMGKYKVSEYSGSKKSTAKTLKYNTLRKGTVLSGVDFKADYYKFYSNKSTVRLYFGGYTAGNMYAYVTHKNNGRTYTWRLNCARDGGFRDLYITIGGKGTWYVKVYRGSYLDNGYYTLKWK